MNFSKPVILYPDSHSLEQSIEHYSALQPEKLAGFVAPIEDRSKQDVTLHTLGNFELRRYDSALLDTAVADIRAALERCARDDEVIEWARLHNSLGNFIAASAQVQADETLYRQAVDAFASALEVYGEQDTPEQWAWAQYNLAAASHALGDLLQSAKPLKAAVDAYTQALMVWTRQDAPLQWALTMQQLGVALHSHGKLLKGNRTLQKSVVAYKNALTELYNDDTGLEFVATRNNRGAVLQNLAESEENPDRMQEALRAYDAALNASMEYQLSIHVAVICRINLACARVALAEMTQDARVAEEAVDELEVIMECFHASCREDYLQRCEQQRSRARELMASVGGQATPQAS